MNSVRVLALLLVALLAGCSKAPDQVDQDFSTDTGALRGVVVDSAIRPVPGATVRAEGAGISLENLTDPEGLFFFPKVPPGLYVIQVTGKGYFPGQTTMTVHAGMPSEVAKIVLEPNVGEQAYVQPHTAEGFIECSTSIAQACGSGNALSDIACGQTGVCPGNVTTGQYYGEFAVGGHASLLQFELVWTPTQSLGQELMFETVPVGDSCAQPDGYVGVINRTRGPSPLLIKISQAEVNTYSLGGSCLVRWQVFPGAADGVPCIENQPPFADDVCFGATAQQGFRVFMHEFHGYLPPETWRFSSDGEPPAPPTLLDA